jgi:hypothetical protein
VGAKCAACKIFSIFSFSTGWSEKDLTEYRSAASFKKSIVCILSQNECLCIYYISKYTKTQALFAYSAANSPKKFMMTKKSQKALDLR